MAATTTEERLLTRALDALAEATRGAVTATRQVWFSEGGANPRLDGQISVEKGNQEQQVGFEVKVAVRLAAVPAIAAQLGSRKLDALPAILITDYAGPQVAQALEEHGVQFLDGAGNAWLDLPGLFISIRGRKPERISSQEDRAKTTWGRGALPVLHVLLNEPEALTWPVRDVARAAAVAVGTAHNTLGELKKRGFLRTIGKGARLTDRARLFDQWVESYPQYLRPRLLRRRLLIPGKPDLREVLVGLPDRVAPNGWALGGEAAAYVLDEYLPPDVLTIYGYGSIEQLATVLDARPAADGQIEVLDSFWAGDRCPGGKPGLVDPMLIYADLVFSGDPRSKEAATRIRDDHIRSD